MRHAIILFFLGVGILAAQTPSQEAATASNLVSVSGTVGLDDGTSAQSGIVSFYQIDPPPDPGATAFVQHAPVKPTGTYSVQLPAGTYRVCAQVWEVPGLDPCLWSDQALSLTVPAQSPALQFPVSVVKGQFLHVRIDDTKGRVLGRGTARPEHNLRIGVATHVGFVAPARLLSTDASGVTYQAIYPLGQNPTLFVQHHGISLGNTAGTNLPREDWSDISNLFSADKHAHADAQHPDVSLSTLDLVP